MKNNIIKRVMLFSGAVMLSSSMCLGADLDITANGAVLIEPKTNTILYSKNAHKKLYPASITKIITALIAAEELDDNTVIEHSEESLNNVPGDSSCIGIQAHSKYKKEEALYGLLLASDNYIAYNLALSVSGNIPDFAAKMNAKAKELGAIDTHFANPHGYHDFNHYTTPYDMAEIAKGAFANPEVAKIAGTRTHQVKLEGTDAYFTINNSSRLLKEETEFYNPNVVSCKTGFHDDARQTLVAKAQYGDLELIAVVMKDSSPDQYVDINKLFAYGSENYAVEKTGDSYKLINNTNSNWSKPYIDKALASAWYEETGKDYKDTMTVNELVRLAQKLGVAHGQKIMVSQITSLLGKGISKDVTKADVAIVANYIANEWGLNLKQYKGGDIPDTLNLNSEKQAAVSTVVKNELMGVDNKNNFNPSSEILREEVITVLCKLESKM